MQINYDGVFCRININNYYNNIQQQKNCYNRLIVAIITKRKCPISRHSYLIVYTQIVLATTY